MKRFHAIHGFSITLLLTTVLLFAACDAGGAATTTTPTPPAVNGFGGNNNHVHSLVALPNHVLVLATHYGIFRSQDDGAHWKIVAAAPGQLMDGLMAYSLTVSPQNPQRLYVLTQLAVPSPKGIIGVYTSSDQGQTWQLATAQTTLATNNIYLAVAGNDTPNEVYIYLNTLGSLGLKVSLDNGQHFSSTGTLPFQTITNMLVLPDMPGVLLAYGAEGLARSSDGGIHWQVLPTINDSIQEVTTTGQNAPIYASGGKGIYVSQDAGLTFTLVSSTASYGSLAVSPTQTQTLYGKTATAVYRSTNGGHSWSALPTISGSFKNLGSLAVDPTDPTQVYLSVSYPTEMYRYQQGTWVSLTPKL